MKKKVEKVESVKEEVVSDVKTIATLDVDFGRGDLNLMRDKLNEIIIKWQ